mgnify:CR=1 FL=1|jgi:hypothetical protein|tara:strand:- start:572 stop:1057 length:486 start_codon:yes stop_codon:yes gene_type:complete
MIAIVDNVTWKEGGFPLPTNLSQWHNIKEEATLLEGTIAKHIIETYVSKYFNISKLVGFEMWTHNNTRPIGDINEGWHYDKDEYFYKINKVLRFPIFSAVLYLKIKNLVGGRLVFDDAKVTPKENRLVLFGPGLRHGVEGYSGERVSLNINGWNRKLENPI